MIENKQVLNDFYLSLGIGIQLLDDDLEVILATSSAQLLPLESLPADIKASKQLTTLTYSKHTHYIVLPFESKPKTYHYFVAGPFQSKCPSKEQESVFKPSYCIPHFEQMLKTIVDQQLTVPPISDLYIPKGIEYIHNHYHEELTLDDVSQHLGINKCYFCSLFKRSTDLTFSQFLNKVRIEASQELLLERSDSVLDIALAVGFNNHNYFSLTFKKMVGMTPVAYRQKHAKSHDNSKK